MDRGEIGRLPYLAVGSGRPMLFLGGLSLVAGVDAAGSEQMAASLVKPFAARRRVLFVNRRKGLPRGMSMTEMAGEHADAIRSLDAGPVDVAGISTGGSIAQQLAADHPDVVGRLVLLSTACRLGPEGRVLQRRVAACPSPVRAPALILAGAGDRFYSRELFAETARLIPGSRLRVLERRGHITVTRHPEWAREIERFLA